MSTDRELSIQSHLINTFLVLIFLIAIFFSIMILSHFIDRLRDVWEFNTNTFPITAATSLLIHSDWTHFYSNMTFLVLLTPIMVFSFGKKKAIFLLFSIGYLEHIFSLLLVTILNFFLDLLYPLILTNLPYDPFNGSIFITVAGRGISGGLAGWMGLSFYQMMNISNFQDSFVKRLIHTVYTLLLLLYILLMSIIDINNFLASYSPFIFMIFPGDFYITFPITRGTPFLSHLFGITFGYAMYNERLRILFSSSIKKRGEGEENVLNE